jgi:hypothetical protein
MAGRVHGHHHQRRESRAKDQEKGAEFPLLISAQASNHLTEEEWAGITARD